MTRRRGTTVLMTGEFSGLRRGVGIHLRRGADMSGGAATTNLRIGAPQCRSVEESSDPCRAATAFRPLLHLGALPHIAHRPKTDISGIWRIDTGSSRGTP
jgi:hypothetical protein